MVKCEKPAITSQAELKRQEKERRQIYKRIESNPEAIAHSEKVRKEQGLTKKGTPRMPKR